MAILPIAIELPLIAGMATPVDASSAVRAVALAARAVMAVLLAARAVMAVLLAARAVMASGDESTSSKLCRLLASSR